MPRAARQLNLYQYTCARAFLKDWLAEFRKLIRRRRGTSALSVALGCAPAQVRNMITGARRLKEPYVTRLIALMGLDAQQATFFRQVVDATYAPIAKRSAAREALAAWVLPQGDGLVDPTRVVALLAELTEMEATPGNALLSTWEAQVLMAWAAQGLPDFPAPRLAHRLKLAVDAAALRRARDRLVEQGLLIEEPKGTLRPATPSQILVGDIPPETYARVHRRSIDRARRDLYDGEPDAHFTWQVVLVQDTSEAVLSGPLNTCSLERATLLDDAQREAMAQNEALDTVFESSVCVLPIARCG